MVQIVKYQDHSSGWLEEHLSFLTELLKFLAGVGVIVILVRSKWKIRQSLLPLKKTFTIWY